MLAKVQGDYNVKLQALRCDKEVIKQKTEEFRENLLGLQTQLEQKTD